MEIRKAHKWYNSFGKLPVWGVALLLLSIQGFAFSDTLITKDMSRRIEALMKKGDMPGLSVVVIKGNQASITAYGYADLDKKIPATSQTVFEIGSCSKAFTALAALKLEKEGKLNLNDPVTKYLPWLTFSYKKMNAIPVTLKQFLHHTSGIPFKTISYIPEDKSERALENTVRTLVGTKLAHPPGAVYEYATINYDVIGLVIQQVSGISFERYLEQEIFIPLGLKNTYFSGEGGNPGMATGYKIGFFSPQTYHAPIFKGNRPAGYVSMNAQDMARWLSMQMGLIPSVYDSLMRLSHQPDMSVVPPTSASYAYGWMVDQYGSHRVFHSGNNPNFTTELAFYSKDSVGVAVMANANSTQTPAILDYVLAQVSGNGPRMGEVESDKVDSIASILTGILALYILLMLAILFLRIRGIIRRKITLAPFTAQTWKKLGLALLLGIPYLYGIYLIPEALIGFSWKAIFVWTPGSFGYMVYMMVGAVIVTYLFYFFSTFLVGKNKYKSAIPVILFLSIISGLANTVVLFIITSSFYSTVSFWYLVYYFILAYGLYVICTKVAQTKLIRLTNGVTFDIRSYLINKLTKTRFQQFEKLSDGRVITTLNGDTSVIANSANIFISFISNLVTIFSAFLYMMTISFYATLVVLGVILLLVWYYSFISNRAKVFMEDARNTINKYTGLLNGLNFGFRQLSIHEVKKTAFRDEIIQVSDHYKHTTIKASLKFMNSMIIGNSFIMIILGMLSIVVPHISTQISVITLISFVMVLLYIIGPINVVLSTIQEVTSVRVAWGRIAGFIKEINTDSVEKISFWEMVESINKVDPVVETTPAIAKNYRPHEDIESIEVKGLMFEYKKNDEKNPDDKTANFQLGPLDFHFRGGEIIFIVGGNGSGKSTFVHLLTGLFLADGGEILVNGKAANPDELGEYFSVIFSGSHLFKRLYGVDLTGREAEVEALIRKVRLEEKVTIKDGGFSTISLSSGQKKRLALLECYLDDRQVFVFDEFAADQDPGFRKYFYRELLPEMRANGKMVIAITHDDHYFDVADKVIKLDYGKMDFITEGAVVRAFE
jgi:putative pyoverdin transport system ATP-binding/permease protein